MACCEAPSPRILEKNNRLFCGNCKRYLDQPPEPPPDPVVLEPVEEETPEPQETET